MTIKKNILLQFNVLHRTRAVAWRTQGSDPDTAGSRFILTTVPCLYDSIFISIYLKGIIIIWPHCLHQAGRFWLWLFFRGPETEIPSDSAWRGRPELLRSLSSSPLRPGSGKNEHVVEDVWWVPSRVWHGNSTFFILLHKTAQIIFYYLYFSFIPFLIIFCWLKN